MAKPKDRKTKARVVPYTVTNEDVPKMVAARACKFGGEVYAVGDSFPKPGTRIVTRSTMQQLYNRGFLTTKALIDAEAKVESVLKGPVATSTPGLARDPIGKKKDAAEKP